MEDLTCPCGSAATRAAAIGRFWQPRCAAHHAGDAPWIGLGSFPRALSSVLTNPETRNLLWVSTEMLVER